MPKTLVVGGDELTRSLLMDAMAGAATPVDVDAAMLADTERAETALKEQAKAHAGATAVIYLARAFPEDETIADYLEEISLGFLFALKLGHALRDRKQVNVLSIIGTHGGPHTSHGEGHFATLMAQGSLRQMVKVASAEWGPIDPPVVVNGLILESDDPAVAPPLQMLLGRDGGYIDGEVMRVGARR